MSAVLPTPAPPVGAPSCFSVGVAPRRRITFPFLPFLFFFTMPKSFLCFIQRNSDAPLSACLLVPMVRCPLVYLSPLPYHSRCVSSRCNHRRKWRSIFAACAIFSIKTNEHTRMHKNAVTGLNTQMREQDRRRTGESPEKFQRRTGKIAVQKV